jgi:hypothetical protein
MPPNGNTRGGTCKSFFVKTKRQLSEKQPFCKTLVLVAQLKNR